MNDFEKIQQAKLKHFYWLDERNEHTIKYAEESIKERNEKIDFYENKEELTKEEFEDWQDQEMLKIASEIDLECGLTKREFIFNRIQSFKKQIENY